MRALILIALLLAFPARAQQAPTPTSSATIGITAATSTSAEATHVIKAAPGNLYSVYATNATATSGFLILYNAVSAPGDGALTGALVLDCVPLPASGAVSVNYAPNPPKVFSVGITAILSSNASCFSKTTGTITGYISGSAP